MKVVLGECFVGVVKVRFFGGYQNVGYGFGSLIGCKVGFEGGDYFMCVGVCIVYENDGV